MFKIEDITKQNEVELKALYNDLSKEIYEISNEFSITRKMEKPHLLVKRKKIGPVYLTAFPKNRKSMKEGKA